VPTIAYLSLGSNLGDREANLRAAIARLGELGEVKKVSSFYETEPVELTEQPWFLNCAVELETERTPGELLEGMLAIEQAMGRERIQPKGPRLIDLDILLFDDVTMKSPGLVIPHPAMSERRFVLEPLAEIAPQARHIELKKNISELLELLPANSPLVRKLTKTV
jgi:2-amino-4-hydroxy-6-hydroxymethyldihydropteridine diphosphokinase